jgi:hypothetical protein
VHSRMNRAFTPSALRTNWGRQNTKHMSPIAPPPREQKGCRPRSQIADGLRPEIDPTTFDCYSFSEELALLVIRGSQAISKYTGLEEIVLAWGVERRSAGAAIFRGRAGARAVCSVCGHSAQIPKKHVDNFL